MRRGMIAWLPAAALLLLAAPVYGGGFAGTYEITKTKRGKAYRGTVSITKRGKAHMVQWTLGSGKRWSGVGLTVGKTLWVARASSGKCQLFSLVVGKRGMRGVGTNSKSGAVFAVTAKQDGTIFKINGRAPSGRAIEIEADYHRGYEAMSLKVGKASKGDGITVLRAGKRRVLASDCDFIGYRFAGKGVRGIAPMPSNERVVLGGHETLLRAKTMASVLVHRERGVTITIPKGWKPGNRRGKYVSARVIGGYQDNLSITITKPFRLHKKNAKALINAVTGQFKKIFKDYKMKSAKLRTMGGFRALRVLGTVTVKGHRLYVDQVVVATPQAGVMIGCNYPTRRKRTTGSLCSKTFASVR